MYDLVWSLAPAVTYILEKYIRNLCGIPQTPVCESRFPDSLLATEGVGV